MRAQCFYERHVGARTLRSPDFAPLERLQLEVMPKPPCP